MTQLHQRITVEEMTRSHTASALASHASALEALFPANRLRAVSVHADYRGRAYAGWSFVDFDESGYTGWGLGQFRKDITGWLEANIEGRWEFDPIGRTRILFKDHGDASICFLAHR